MRRFATFASGLFACVVGCGDDGVNKLADAPPPPEDAGIDAPVTGTANVTTNVRCCLVAPGTPQAGVTVAVIHADHSLGQMATSDAQGKASVTVRPGDSVTAIYPEDIDSTTDVVTFLGVKPGDNLTFGEGFWTLPQTPGVTGQVNVSWPAVTNAAYYRLLSPCGVYGLGTVTSMTITVDASCQTATAPLVFAAYDANNRVIASSYLPAAPWTPGTIPEITWTTTTPPNYTLSVSGLSATTSSAYFQAYSIYPRFFHTDGGSTQITGNAATIGLSTTTGSLRDVGLLELQRFGSNGRQDYFKAQANAVTFTESMPWVSGVAVDATQGQAVWLQTAGTYDAALLYLYWSRFDGKVSQYFNWTLVVPPGVKSLDVGAPPAALADYLPKLTDSVNSQLYLIDLSTTTTYDQVRALPESTLVDLEIAVETGVVPAASLSTLSSGEGFALGQRR